MYELCNGNYKFIAMEKMSKAREKMGWKMDSLPEYVVNYSECKEKCDDWIFDADVVICSCGYEVYIKKRLTAKKLVFIYSERWHKIGYNPLKLIKHIPVNFMKYNRFKNCYMLCSSAFAAYDCSRSFTFLNKCYKWGYFPAFIPADDIAAKITTNRSEKANILYVSRLIPLKHPDLPLRVVKKLKDDGIPCHLTMIGQGPLKNSLLCYAKENNIEDDVSFIDSVSPEQVREYMDKSQVFLFTSDRNEGWGAVLNEAMNSGCAVVSSSAIGSTPFLINDNVNGYVYKDGDFDDLYLKTKELVIDTDKQKNFGINAYNTIFEKWNANEAAKRFVALSVNILSGKNRFLFSDGPCSKANVQKDDWYK